MNKKIFSLLGAACASFILLACSENVKVSDELEEAQTDLNNPTGRSERAPSNPSEKPIRIGEGGPRFDACQAVGEIRARGDKVTKLLIAPFDSAKSKDELQAGQFVYICTRSHDQQWFGIIYDDGLSVASPQNTGNAAKASDNEERPANDLITPPFRGPGDCGVSSPVRAKRKYDGPCKSGWVESISVRLVAG